LTHRSVYVFIHVVSPLHLLLPPHEDERQHRGSSPLPKCHFSPPLSHFYQFPLLTIGWVQNRHSLTCINPWSCLFARLFSFYFPHSRFFPPTRMASLPPVAFFQLFFSLSSPKKGGGSPPKERLFPVHQRPFCNSIYIFFPLIPNSYVTPPPPVTANFSYVAHPTVPDRVSPLFSKGICYLPLVFLDRDFPSFPPPHFPVSGPPMQNRLFSSTCVLFQPSPPCSSPSCFQPIPPRSWSFSPPPLRREILQSNELQLWFFPLFFFLEWGWMFLRSFSLFSLFGIWLVLGNNPLQPLWYRLWFGPFLSSYILDLLFVFSERRFFFSLGREHFSPLCPLLSIFNPLETPLLIPTLSQWSGV